MEIAERFFKAYDIKEQWFVEQWDYESKCVGSYLTYQEMYETMRNCNDWTHEETLHVIERECYKQYPRLTDEVLYRLVALLSIKLGTVIIQGKTHDEVKECILTHLINNKDLFEIEIKAMFGICYDPDEVAFR